MEIIKGDGCILLLWITRRIKSYITYGKNIKIGHVEKERLEHAMMEWRGSKGNWKQ